VNKGAGLLNLAMLLGIRQEETIAIGDNYNDLSMIRAAGLGVGVANTVPEMKNQCDVITRATHEDGAVEEGCSQTAFGKGTVWSAFPPCTTTRARPTTTST
jgi:hypothetical protein